MPYTLCLFRSPVAFIKVTFPVSVTLCVEAFYFVFYFYFSAASCTLQEFLVFEASRVIVGPDQACGEGAKSEGEAAVHVPLMTLFSSFFFLLWQEKGRREDSPAVPYAHNLGPLDEFIHLSSEFS